MKYKTEKAINRLSWRFSNNKSFKPNEEDIDSLNCILEWMNREIKNNVRNNQLFAKLYIYFLHQNIKFYNSTVFDNIPQKDLSKLLDLPLDSFYKSFHKDLHFNQFNRVKTIEDLKSVKESYTIENVTERLDFMINEALNRFS